MSRSSSPGVELIPGQVSFIVVSDATLLDSLGASRWVWTAEQKRALDDLPPLQLPVILENLAVEVWDEEHGDEKRDTGTHTKNGARELPILQVDSRGATFPYDQHRQEGRREEEVKWHSNEGHLYWIFRAHDSVLGGEEDDGRKNAGDAWSDGPGGEDLGDTVPRPVHTIGADGSNTHANNTTHDRVGCRYGHSEACCDCKPY